MATISIKSSNRTETYSLDAAAAKTNQLRDPSFSSYLNASEQNSVRKLAPVSTRPNGVSFSFNPQDLLDLHLYMGLKHPQEDEEIEVFEAEKYFNGAMDLQDFSPRSPTPTMKEVNFSKKEQEQEQNTVVEQKTPTLHAGTASVSSTNSQSAFLGRPVHHRKKANRFRRRSLLLAALGCNCSCSDSGSVDVLDDDEVAPATSTQTRTTEISYSSWNRPVSNNPWISEETMQRQKHETFRSFPNPMVEAQSPKQEKNPRKSLEVFGSPSSGNMEFLSMEMKNPRTMEDMNTDSDASSDLFEIESLTGKVNSYLTRQASDATSDQFPTAAWYTPSEASIEWSVVTASAADFSLMSDFEERNNLSIRTNDMELRQQAGPRKIAKNGGEVHRRWSSGSFLGCKSQKAVEVAGDAFRSVSRRFQGEEKVDSREVQRGSSDLGFGEAASATRFQVDTGGC